MSEDLAEQLRAARLELAEAREMLQGFGLRWADRADPLEDDIRERGAGLRVVPERCLDADADAEHGSAHLLIEGDNLMALTALASARTADVDLIYIDPPYNTGNSKRTGFTYSDRFRSPEDEERHSAWLSMMRRRLDLARTVMKTTGCILISIDDNEVHHLRVLCDQVFGEHNFIAQMVWDGGNVKNNAKYISGTHEYVLVYAKSLAAMSEAGIIWREPRPGTDLLLAKYEALKAKHGSDHARISAEMKTWVKGADLSKRLKVFTGVDERGLYTYADLSAPGGKGARYDVMHPVTGKACIVPSRGWGYTQERMGQLLADDRVLFGADETFQPMRKLYLLDKTDQVRRSILDYPARSSTHLIEHMLGKRGAFNNPKNLDMLCDLIALIAPKDGVIMDFFAGSGTTGHAVLTLNARDEGTRQFILVTNNENEICHTVTWPRIKAAVDGRWGNGTQAPALGGNVRFMRCDWLKDEASVNEQALSGLVEALAGAAAEASSHTMHADGRHAVFCWDGQGRKADAQRAWERFRERAGRPVITLSIGDESLDCGEDSVLAQRLC